MHVCHMADTPAISDEEHEANTNLVRTAPELYEALEAALEWIDAVPSSVQLPTMPGIDRDWIDSVLSKANGES